MSIYYFKRHDFSILTDAFALLASVWIPPVADDTVLAATRHPAKKCTAKKEEGNTSSKEAKGCV
jgi:hypothetical protein